jgi:hypothetical protein
MEDLPSPYCTPTIRDHSLPSQLLIKTFCSLIELLDGLTDVDPSLTKSVASLYTIPFPDAAYFYLIDALDLRVRPFK